MGRAKIGTTRVHRPRLSLLPLAAATVLIATSADAAINVTGGRVPSRTSDWRLPRVPSLKGRRVQSTATYHAFSFGELAGNLIHPDPDDPSDCVFIDVEPAEVTITAGETAVFNVAVDFQDDCTRAYVISSAGFPGTGFDYDLSRFIHTPANNTSTLEIFPLQPNSVVPGTYEFYVVGLATGNDWTEHATFTVIVEPAPSPPPTDNAGTVVIEESNLNVFAEGTYALDGTLNQVGALYDNEADHVVNVESGSNSVIYPRWPFFFQNGTWSLQTGRRYADNARLIIWGLVNATQFVAVHMNVATNGDLTPALLIAGDLNSDGTVLSTDEFEYQMSGSLPSSSGPGRLQGTVDAVPFFEEPNLSGNLWANRITFTFDVPVYND